MSRSGYTDDCDDSSVLGRWRGMVAQASRGKRGKKFFSDLIAALDAMPHKQLVIEELITPDSGVCALGALGLARKIDMDQLDPEDPEQVGLAFDIAPCLAQETVYMNDERFRNYSPEQRWDMMRKWAIENVGVSYKLCHTKISNVGSM